MAGAFSIGGLVSGLDTAKIIEQLMTLEQRPIKQLESQQQRVKDRRQAYIDLSTKLSILRQKSLNLLLSSGVKARTATSSDTSVATATAASGTPIQSFGVEVVQLATKSSLTSPSPIGNSIDTFGATLDSAGFGITPTTGSFSINGTNVTVDVTVDTIGDFGPNDILQRINATVPGVTASINASGNGIDLVSTTGPIVIGVHGNTSNFLTATKLAASTSVHDPVAGTWTNSSTGGIGAADPTATLDSARLSGSYGTATGSFTINGVSFSWDHTVDSINSLVSDINASAAKVTASYDSATDTFSLVAKDTGPAAIAVSDDSGTLLGALGITAAVQQHGLPAQYKINGGPVQSSTSNTITNAVPGVTLTLKDVGTTTVGVAQDTATAVNGVKEWVAAYNDAAGLARQLMAVDPTTNEASIFTGNPLVQSVSARLRQVVNTKFATGTNYTELPNIGLNTGPIGSTPGTTNDLILDEAKLTQALTADATAVETLLTSATGPIGTLNTYLQNATSFTGPIGSSQRSADRELRDIDSRMRSLQQRLNTRQAQLEKKFAALESAMAKLQAQSAQLAGQLSQLGAMGGGQ